MKLIRSWSLFSFFYITDIMWLRTEQTSLSKILRLCLLFGVQKCLFRPCLKWIGFIHYVPLPFHLTAGSLDLLFPEVSTEIVKRAHAVGLGPTLDWIRSHVKKVVPNNKPFMQSEKLFLSSYYEPHYTVGIFRDMWRQLLLWRYKLNIKWIGQTSEYSLIR